MTLPRLPTLLVLLARPGLRALVRRCRRAGLETLLDYPRLAVLAAAVQATRHVPGDVIECGSYRGGSAGLMGQRLVGSGKTLHVCDSFMGLPPAGDRDNFHQAGDFNDTSWQAVASGLAELAVPCQIHPGLFQQTLPRLEHTTFSLVHIDVDLYESVLECLRFSYPRLAAGGALVLDDFGSPTCLGAKAAAEEFFHDKIERPVRLANTAHGILKGRPDAEVSSAIQRHAGWLFASAQARRLAFG